MSEKRELDLEHGDPIEDGPWPKSLPARVVTPGARPRIHGYDVEGDLSRSYTFSDLIFLSIVGELPRDEIARPFDVALQFLAPLAVTEGPTHAAVLTRLCGGSTSAIASTATIGNGERARVTLAEHAPFLSWLSSLSSSPSPSSNAGELPAIARARDDDERASVRRLRDAIAPFDAPALAEDLSREAALIALLHACGLRTPDALEAAIVVARLVPSMMESLAWGRGALRDYPMTLPPFAYEETPR